VLDLRTGTYHAWSLPGAGTATGQSPSIEHLSWLSDSANLLVTIEEGESDVFFDDEVEVLNTSLPVEQNNPRYIGPVAGQLSPAGWSLATPIPGSDSIAALAEHGVTDPYFKYPEAYDNIVLKVSLLNDKSDVWFQPNRSGESYLDGFVITDMAFDSMGGAYFVGAFQCGACSGGSGSFAGATGYNLYHYSSRRLAELPGGRGFVAAIAWLPHTFIPER
jgi:hypothetical protein